MRLNHFGVFAGALLFASAISATPLGTMSLGIVTGGGVNVKGTRIDFFPPSNIPPAGAGIGFFATGNPTSINYNDPANQTLTAATNPFGQISDLDLNFPPLGVNFIQFYTSLLTPPAGGLGLVPNLAFDITGIGPGGPAQGAINGCAGAGVGVRCSPSIGGGLFSPFVLTDNGINTDVSLSVILNGRDSTGSAAWKGGFTTQISITPDAAETLLNSGGIITNTWSFTATSIPEPSTLSALGSGLMLIGLATWRKRK